MIWSEAPRVFSLLAVVSAQLFTVAALDALAAVALVVILGTGGWYAARRTGVIDLAAGAAVGAGAYVGGVVPAEIGVGAWWGVPLAMAAGATVTLTSFVLSARAGRVLGSLGSLAVGLTVTGVLVSVPHLGGRAGYHAVPLLTPDLTWDVVAITGGALAVIALAVAADRWAATSRASVAVRAPHVSASLGRSPTADAALGGAGTGAVLGVGGMAAAAWTGSVQPDAYGLSLAVALLLAGLVGGRHPLGVLVGTAIVLVPGTVLGLGSGGIGIPVAALVGLLVLVVRPAGIVASTRRDPLGAGRSCLPRPREGGARLVVEDAPLPNGATVSFRASPGEVVALVGPNGAGKSTLLAYIAGQVPDRGTVRIADELPPAGAGRRARLGVARTWQRPRTDHLDDALRVSLCDEDAARWARDQLGRDARSPAGADLVRLAARAPRLALLDEPAASLPVEVVAGFVRGLAEAGITVVVAEHREEVVHLADRVVRLGGARDE